MSWPAEIDVFLAVGELALYVAYLDGWPVRQRVWPWATTLGGPVVSVAGNVGHIQPLPGQPVLLADRLTAAASPLAAFAGLTVGLLVLRMNRQRATVGQSLGPVGQVRPIPAMPELDNGHHPTAAPGGSKPIDVVDRDQAVRPAHNAGGYAHAGASPALIGESPLLQDAAVIYRTAAARGERLIQRALARTLRGHGHRFPNQSLRDIALAIGLGAPPDHLPAANG
jgi:hypothetical protein